MNARHEQHELELAVHQHRADTGTQAIRSWLYARRNEINDKFPDAPEEELPRLKYEAKLVIRLIRLIEQGPRIKTTEERKPT